MRIGFVDHHLNNFHANKFLALLHGPLEDLGARVTGAWESDPTGDDWCAKNGIPRAGSPEAVAADSDAVIVLAPDNIDAHLALCRSVFAAGKPVMVDKFLSPTLAEAEEILRLAREHGVPVFPSSSLRFAVELEAALAQAPGSPAEAYARGVGEWDGYGIHTLAMALRAMGDDSMPRRLIDTGTGGSAVVTLEYPDGRRAWVECRSAANQWETLEWAFGFRVGDRYVTGAVRDFDGFYANLMRRAVEFFRTGRSPVSPDEMLKTVAVLEGASRSRAAGGAWIDLE
jgi:predicted dehydrogenase